MTEVVNVAPVHPSQHVSATEPAGNGLHGNREWDWSFTSFSHFAMLN